MKMFRKLRLWWIHLEHRIPDRQMHWCVFCRKSVYKRTLKEEQEKKLAKEFFED